MLSGSEVFMTAQEPDFYTDDYYCDVLGIATTLGQAQDYARDKFDDIYGHHDDSCGFRLLDWEDDGPTGYKARVAYDYLDGRAGTIDSVCFVIRRYYLDR